MRLAELGERLLGCAARGFGGGALLGSFRGLQTGHRRLVLRLFGERGVFLRCAQFGGKALALLMRGAEFVLQFFHGGGEAAVFRGGLPPVRRLRGRAGGELRSERVFFRSDGVPLGEQFFDAPAVAFDVLLELRRGPRLPRLRCRCRPKVRAGFLEFRREPGARGVRAFDLLLGILQRAGGLGFAFAGGGFKFALHRRVRLLDVRGAFAVQAVGRGELPFEFDLGLLFPLQIERGLALVGFERGDAALEFVDLPRAFLPARRGGGVARHRQPELAAFLKFGDLLRERGLLLREVVALGGQLGDAPVGVLALCRLGLERGQFALERLGFLLRFGEIFGGFRGHAFLKGNLLDLVVRRGLRAHHFGDEPLALLGDRLALLRERGEMPLEFSLRPRELRAHGFARAEEFLAGKFVVVLERRVEGGAAGIQRQRERAIVGDDPHVGNGRRRDGRDRLRGGCGGGVRDAAGFRHAGHDVAGRPLPAQALGQGLRGIEREALAARGGAGRGAGVGQQAHHFLPGEADFRVIRGEDLLAENLRRAPVNLGQRDGRLPAPDAVGEFGDVELQFGGRVVRAVVELLFRDAGEKIAEVEEDLVLLVRRGHRRSRGFRPFFRRPVQLGRRPGRRWLHLGFGLVRRGRTGRLFGGAAVRVGAFETIEK